MEEGDAIRELADVVEAWFNARSEQLQGIIDGCTKSNGSIMLKTPDGDVEMTGDKLKGFVGGLAVAAELFDKLPFTLEDAEPEDEELEDEDPTPVLDHKVPETPKPEGYGVFS
jgi:hypothetical protein